MMTRLVPNIFFSSLSDGLDLFVRCPGFTDVCVKFRQW